MRRYVLDTNIVSLIVKRDKQVVSRYATGTSDEDEIILCPMVWYEARRGLLARSAVSQIRQFHLLINTFIWQDFTQDDWKLASELWAKRVVKGSPVTDADLLIAVFSLNRNAILVTNNEKHFVDLGVTIENWTK